MQHFKRLVDKVEEQ